MWVPVYCPCDPCRQVDLQPHEILYKVTIPFTQHHEYVKEFKQSPRREDDIAIVNAGMRVRLGRNSVGRCHSMF